jgi:hypothetical protein
LVEAKLKLEATAELMEMPIKKVLKKSKTFCEFD